MKIKLSDLWRWDGKIDRGPYLVLGITLFILKYNVDRFVSSWLFDKPWSIFQYQNVGELLVLPSTADKTQLFALSTVALPFLWSGIVLSIRRLRSAGLPLVLVALFIVPIVKIVFFMALSVLPSESLAEREPTESNRSGSLLGGIIPKNQIGSAAMGILVALILTLAGTWLGTFVFKDYGWSLFIGLPFCMGFFSVLVYGFHAPRTLGSCLQVALYTVLIAGVGLLLFAFEGLICLLMAALPAAIMALVGGAVAYAIQTGCRWREQSPRVFCSVILAVPLTMWTEHYQRPPAPLLKVTSSIVVNASPEKVWRNVVTFSELPPPKEWMFRAGIAYPIRAEIQGQGVGAVRYCNFSTGPFVEPIEVWNEPELLKFSVTHNPSPMQELTPYHEIHPPHLDGFLVSKGGQFHLVKLGDGQTLLEGTTWYYHNLWPAKYWQFWSDYIIHTIHLRVLNHVKQLSEEEINK